MKFAHPAWLILLVLLPLLAAASLAVARLRRKQWAAFIAPRLRPHLLKRSPSLPRWIALLTLLAASASIIIALARPQAESGTRTEKSLGRNVLIALDLSRSMRVRDVKPDRLIQAKTVIYELLDAMPNERIGLIGFAGSADLYAPLTIDHNAVRETVEQIDESWPPRGGSDLAAAIRLATDTLRKTGQKNNALVILSDGEKHDGNLDKMISEAQQSGVYILAIGVGTEDGDFVPDPATPGGRMLNQRGEPIISRLQPELMRELASETNGRYARAGTNSDLPTLVRSTIKDLDAFEMEGRERTISIEFYQWLVLPAILLLLSSLLAATHWRGVNPTTTITTLLAASLFLSPPHARADAVSTAKDLLERKQFPQARDAYENLANRTPIPTRKARFRIGEATAAYRAADFRHARTAYSQALLAPDPAIQNAAHLGLASSLFQLGWKGLADAPYPTAQAPDLASFDAIVRTRLQQIMESESPGTLKSFESTITNWTDAIRHYQTVLSATPTNQSALHNRKVTITYLKRLQQLLEDHQQKIEQSIPQPQAGEPDSQPKKPGEGDSGEQDENPDSQGPKSSDPQNNPQEDPEQDPNDGDPNENPPQKPDQPDDTQEPNPDAQDPNESPEERARRILKENADLEKGPLTPGRREFLPPKKDW